MNSKKIIIAEDEKLFSLVLESVLEKIGYTVTVAEDGQQALDKIVQSNWNKFDLLITDINMPIMSGIDLIKQLNKLNINLPVIVMTGETDKKKFNALSELGMSHIIKKPHLNELKDKIISILT